MFTDCTMIILYLITIILHYILLYRCHIIIIIMLLRFYHYPIIIMLLLCNYHQCIIITLLSLLYLTCPGSLWPNGSQVTIEQTASINLHHSFTLQAYIKIRHTNHTNHTDHRTLSVFCSHSSTTSAHALCLSIVSIMSTYCNV